MAQLLKGKDVSDALTARLTADVDELKKQGIHPCLAILRVGERGDDISYEKGAMKRCEAAGVLVRNFVYPETISQSELMETIVQINQDAGIHGLLLFRPLPSHLDEKAVMEVLDPAKDVDGITPASMAGVYAGSEVGFPPCTPRACMEILEYYDIDLTGKKVAVIGRSLVVGKPAAMMVMKKNGTVTVCHTKTLHMEEITREADVLLVAAGKSETIGRDFVREGQIVLDVGIHLREDGSICGDVNFAEVEPVVEAITPVPGGVGTVTTGVLVLQVVEAAVRQSRG
jgi:methylenetetrahydrofolate dehydrogenase (NADP+)/methenyltetrahydrofolate cyclohydrolase